MGFNNRTGVGSASLTLARLGLAWLGFALLDLAIMGSDRVGTSGLKLAWFGSATLC